MSTTLASARVARTNIDDIYQPVTIREQIDSRTRYIYSPGEVINAKDRDLYVKLIPQATIVPVWPYKHNPRAHAITEIDIIAAGLNNTANDRTLPPKEMIKWPNEQVYDLIQQYGSDFKDKGLRELRSFLDFDYPFGWDAEKARRVLNRVLHPDGEFDISELAEFQRSKAEFALADAELTHEEQRKINSQNRAVPAEIKQLGLRVLGEMIEATNAALNYQSEYTSKMFGEMDDRRFPDKGGKAKLDNVDRRYAAGLHIATPEPPKITYQSDMKAAPQISAEEITRGIVDGLKAMQTPAASKEEVEAKALEMVQKMIAEGKLVIPMDKVEEPAAKVPKATVEEKPNAVQKLPSKR